jgi:hypothetical protein
VLVVEVERDVRQLGQAEKFPAERRDRRDDHVAPLVCEVETVMATVLWK